MYSLQISTELMKNQKAGQILADSSQFDALQTSDGLALFFGISDTGLLYLTREQQNAATGWTPIDLTTELGGALSGRTVTAKAFAVSQEPTTGDIMIAQVVHTATDDQDHLFVLAGLSSDPAADWLEAAGPRQWFARPYDDLNYPASTLTLAYVKSESTQNTGSAPFLVVGVEQQTSYIQNYLVSLDPTKTTGVWQRYVTAENYTALVDMAIGMAAAQSGLYELYTLSGETGLSFTPRSSGPVVVRKMAPPAGSSALGVVPYDAVGHTNLYVAANGAIYLFPPSQQGNTGTPTAVISHPLVAGVDTLEVNIAGDQVTLWGRNASGTVFYSRCAADQQTVAGAWSTPIPIAQGVDQVSSLLNVVTGFSALFAHTSGQNLEKLTQDPVTTQWSAQALLLPALSSAQVYEYYTFTTHVEVLDENSMPSPSTPVPISSTSPVAVYVNDVYTTLDNSASVSIESSSVGTLTIVQETQTLGAVCYNLASGDGTTSNVNPMRQLLTTLGGVTQGSGLDLTVTDELDQESPLVPSSVTSSQKDAVARCLQGFVGVSQSLPTDGTVSTTAAARPTALAAASAPGAFGLSFANSDVTYLDSVVTVDGAIEAFAGDVLHWIEHVVDDVVQFVVQSADGIAHFFVTIAEDVYHFVLTCASDVMHGIQFIFTKIGVAFEKLVQWLGFIFSWNDILRMKAVAKNFFVRYSEHAIANLSAYQDSLTDLAKTLQDKIDTWSGLPAPDSALGTQVAGARPLPGGSHPAAHWGTDQLNGNANAAFTSTTTTDSDVSAFEQVFADILGAIDTERTDIGTACLALKAQVFDQISTLSLGDIIKRVFGIIGDLVVETLENLVIAVIEVLQDVAQSAVDALGGTIDIPVLSWVYEKFAHAPLSFLDLACLITAIPATVVYKITHGTAPFPDDPTTDALIAAPDFSTIQNILAGTSTVGRDDESELGGVQLASAEKRWQFSATVLAFAASRGVAMFTAMRIYQPDSVVAAIGGAACYLPYCAPDIGVGNAQTWDQIMNETITALSVVKTTIDISLYRYVTGSANNGAFLGFWGVASPWIEFAISAAWMVPTLWAVYLDQSVQRIVSVISNVSFNLTGLFGIYATLAQEPVTKLVFTGIIVATIAVYGDGIFASSFLAGVKAEVAGSEELRELA